MDTEYSTSNRRIRYPFSDDTVIGIPDDLNGYVFGCFTDAMIQAQKDYHDLEAEVSNMSLTGHTLHFDLVTRYDGAESSVHLMCTRSKERFPVLHGINGDTGYTFVLSSTGIRELEDKIDEIGDISGLVLPISSHCTGLMPQSVRRLLVYDGKRINPETGVRYTVQEAVELPEDKIHVLNGDVSVIEGNNITLSYSEAGIDIGAAAGSGAGVLPCPCEDSGSDPEETSGLWRSDGHVRLFNDTCYDLMPIDKETIAGETYADLKIYAKCKACCTCDMYASIVNDRMIPLRDSIRRSYDKITSVNSVYEENVAKWNDRLSKALPEDIVISATAVPLDAAATDLNGGSVTGQMDRCGMSVILKNDSFVTVRIDCEDFSCNGATFQETLSWMEDDQPVVNQIDLQRSDSSECPLFSVVLKPGKSATLSLFARLRNMVRTDHQHGFLTLMTVAAYQDDTLVVRKTEELSV